MDFQVVDITRPRDPALIKKSQGSTALPILETADGQIIKESLVILEYLDASIGATRISQADPYLHSIEQMLIAKEGEFIMSGYLMVMNQDPEKQQTFATAVQRHYKEIDSFLSYHSPGKTFLFDTFGLAEVVFTPIFMRFWFLEYYEGFQLPDEPAFQRVACWRDACLSHEAAQQVSKEEIVKLYYDYAKGAGNGELLPGRKKSSFVFSPDWHERPWPPRDKYGTTANDRDLGLI